MRSIRLRTKFLLSLLAVSAMLTAGTLIVVSNVVRMRMRDNLRTDLRASVNTFEIFQKQRDEAFTSSSQLLANLPNVKALMMTDAATIQDASAETYRRSGADLLVMADRTGQVAGLRNSDSSLTREEAQRLLRGSLQHGAAHDWWYGGNHLYQVWIQKISTGPNESTIGFLILGERIDNQAAKDFSTIASGDVAFFQNDVPVAGTVEGLNGPSVLRQVSAGSNKAAEIQIGKEHYVGAALSLSDNPPVTLVVFKSFDKATAFLSRLNRVLIALGVLSLLVGSLIVFLISDTFTRPLSNLVLGVRALESGDYEYPLNVAQGDEVAEVTTAFDRMRTTLQKNQEDQKDLEGRLRQAHKMEAIGRLAGGVAHDFNNLLTIIGGNSDLLLDRAGGDDFHRRCVEQIQKAARRAVSMTRQLLAFSRMQVLQPQVLDLNSIIGDMGKMLPRLIGEHIEYVFSPEPKLPAVKADPGQIEQVLMNLAVNARDAMPNGGTLTVQTENIAMSEAEAAKRPPMTSGNYVRLSVTDTGHGMDEKTKAHIFEPFFTTKEVGKGTGLGLATVYGVVKQSGGFIWVESVPDQGATFEIYLPLASGPVMRIDAEARPSVAAQGHETVLVVEDEPDVRELACRFLRVKGYSVLEAKDGADAIEVAAAHKGSIHAVVTDMVMPRIGGADLIRALKTARPEILVIFMTGYSEYLKGDLTDVFPGSLILQKPFSPASLVGIVREALAKKSGNRADEPEGARTV
ncbi:MAG TPA: ATP-binding protein [Candidatus Acidoferrales bacterium]|nr:ATP-binding protein [Candidatus Acidoferrales bacterium]